MDPSLEIRKLLPSQIKELVIILETHELWKRLMSIIPKTLNSDFVCDINFHNHAKYHSEHFRLIENASDKTKKTCTEILFDEWGTSGKIRPTLGHLLYLLTKAKLFRAADYVAVNLLNRARPERPEIGPEARIQVDLITESNNESNDIDELLDQIDYPSQAVNIIRTNSVEARSRTSAAIPKIVITPEEETPLPEFTIPLVVPRTSSPVIQNVSDMMKFSKNSSDSRSTNESDSYYTSSDYSTEVNSDIQPAFSQLLDFQNPPENLNEHKQAHTDMIIYSKSGENSKPSSLETDECLPISELLGSNGYSESNIPNLSALNNFAESAVVSLNSQLLPNFDKIMKSDNAPISNHPESTSQPDFDMLMSALGAKNKSKKLSWTSLSNDSRSRTCTSPLPNLSLITMLPHFNYVELEAATNFFNSAKYSEDNSDGRFLGSGAFGSVFLALGILNRPVAVKKLNLENVEVVNIDDTVTKQFRNEVEVLSKYKHEHLLSLLGYSCDGCTYCLLYEYIPGGALKDRLQVSENRLGWRQRIDIAVGTANAVAYLHTAFSSPLIHRDIKSANILLDCESKPKLCDFGLIKLSPTQHTSTATTVFGTSAYMAPEAFRGDISVKLDTFSFGVVLLELLTSLAPMDGNRDGTDLITHVGENCENDDISPILDKSVGTWQQGDENYANKLFKVAMQCLEEKKKRPNMVEVSEKLSLLIEDMKLDNNQ